MEQSACPAAERRPVPSDDVAIGYQTVDRERNGPLVRFVSHRAKMSSLPSATGLLSNPTGRPVATTGRTEWDSIEMIGCPECRRESNGAARDSDAARVGRPYVLVELELKPDR